MAKRALCVGINDYPGTGSDLRGCVNDARDWEKELADRGYEVQILLDGAATRAGMVEALTALINEAKEGDCLVFTFSGHGSWQPDDDADEPRPFLAGVLAWFGVMASDAAFTMSGAQRLLTQALVPPA